MDVEIVPQPSEDELRAILAALAPGEDEAEVPSPYRSAWRLAALSPDESDGDADGA